MRALNLWLRRNPLAADSALALLLFSVEIAGAAAATHPVSNVLLGLLTYAPLAVRRRHPVTSAVVVWFTWPVAIVLSLTVDATPSPLIGVLGGIVALYTLVAHVGRRAGALYVVALVVGVGFTVAAFRTDAPQNALVFFLALSLAWISAEFSAARSAYDGEVRARLDIAENERDRRAIDAVADERARIARELHDVVAHAVSVMIVQADGASFALRRDPDRAEVALGHISSTGRQALTELRRTVSLLRTDDADDSHPQYGTAALARIVETMRSAGLIVQLEQTGNIDDISPAVSLGVHRLVQESLTNVLRHAGDSPRAKVVVTRREIDVVVEVVDNGSGELRSRGKKLVGSGNGLLGMRERVAVLGGTVDVGPRADGSWKVRAELPLQAEL